MDEVLHRYLSNGSPVELALDELELIGRGSVAYVFAHPENPSLAIRLADYPDAWFEYAMYVADMDPGVSLLHAPRVHAMACRDGYFAAVVDRLQPIHDENWVQAAIAMARGGLPDPAEHATMLASNPDFARFVEDFPGPITDLRDDNFMLRHDKIVVNDPWGRAMSDTARARFEAEHGLGGSPVP